MFVYDLFNNTVICSDDTVENDGIDSWIVRLQNKVFIAQFKLMAYIYLEDLTENMIHLTVEPVCMKRLTWLKYSVLCTIEVEVFSGVLEIFCGFENCHVKTT